MTNTYRHTGIDLFFNNITKGQLKMIVETLNNMDLTIKGHHMVWRVNTNRANTITCKYPVREYTHIELMKGLMTHRKTGESFARVINKEFNSNIGFDGSEFYLEKDKNLTENLVADMKKLEKA